MNNDVLTVFRNGITYTCNPKCTGNIDKSVIRRNQVYFSSSNVSTDTTIIIKDWMLSEKFTFCFKITIKWNLTKSHATRLKSAKYKLM